LTARGLNPKLFILARAGEEVSEKKLMRAGASKVISPYTIGANRMAQAILRPSVVDFIELATASENLELQIGEIVINANSELAGKSLVESGIRQSMGIIIVGIKQLDGQMVFNPPFQKIIEPNSTLIVLGERPSIDRLEQIAGGDQR
jgi:voltage-gated potassium channel